MPVGITRKRWSDQHPRAGAELGYDAAVSKPPSRLRRATREFQLALSLGVVAIFLHAVLTSALFLHWEPPAISSPVVFDIIRALAGRGDLLVICPALSAGAAYAFGVSPWSSSLGTVGLVETTMVFMHWARGGFDEEQRPFMYLLPYWVVSVLAFALAVVAAKWAAARASRLSATPVAASPGAPTAAGDFAEQMRAAQERAKASEPPSPPSAEPPSVSAEKAPPPDSPT